MTVNFSLKELIHSGTALRYGYNEQFNPPIEVLENLELLTKYILQPLRDAIGSPIYIHSAYRCKKVNTKIGGSLNSQHILGQAADIEDYENGNEYLYNKILELNLPFDQLINEFNFNWIHISYSGKHRRQQLKAISQNGKTIYI